MKTYICPMHPAITSKKPGRCPKCGMNLVLGKNDNHMAHGEKHSHYEHQMKPVSETSF